MWDLIGRGYFGDHGTRTAMKMASRDRLGTNIGMNDWWVGSCPHERFASCFPSYLMDTTLGNAMVLRLTREGYYFLIMERWKCFFLLTMCNSNMKCATQICHLQLICHLQFKYVICNSYMSFEWTSANQFLMHFFHGEVGRVCESMLDSEQIYLHWICVRAVIIKNINVSSNFEETRERKSLIANGYQQHNWIAWYVVMFWCVGARLKYMFTIYIYTHIYICL